MFKSYLNRLINTLRSVPKQTWFGLGIALFLWWIFMHHTRWPSGHEQILEDVPSDTTLKIIEEQESLAGGS